MAMKTTRLLSLTAFLVCANVLITVAQTSTVTISFDNSQVGMERSGAPTEPVPGMPDFAAYSWTCNSVPCIGRTLMTVDLSMIPDGALILDARLSLFADPACSYLGYYGQPTYGENNGGYVRRITSPWDAATLTWQNKPTASKRHQLLLNSSSTDVQDYINQDITRMVQDMMDYPSYGILLRMGDEENHYKSLIFGSGLNDNPALRPQLTVTYRANGLHERNTAAGDNLWEAEAYPNPAPDRLTFEFPFVGQQDVVAVTVYSVTGQLLRIENLTAINGYSMDVSSLHAGCYFFKVENKTSHNCFAGKFLKQ